VFVAIDRLLVRLRHVPSRAAELTEVRDRLRAERRAVPSDEERAAALEVRRIKRAMSAGGGAVTECSRCATGLPGPGGAFTGGYCCSAATADLFNADEVALLAQGGTRLADLPAPRSQHAGCAFRGETGCTLHAEDRPAICVRFHCLELRRELHRHGRLDMVEKLEVELEAAYRTFIHLRAARLDREELAQLLADVAADIKPPARDAAKP
jgi:hypothetical protein